MKLERGSYSCDKAATQSSITHVIEENENGEATKIEHFLHEGHCLVLADKMEEETGRKCDGCMPPVSTLQVYYCLESDCHFCLHKNCAKLPKINILWFRQSNATLQSKSLRCDLSSTFEKQELTRQDCKICFEEVERGSYSCVKAGCNYVVHVKCALADKDLYDVIEEECQCQKLNAATQSSITHVIGVNEDGEATKIEHLSHEGHCLVLADKMEEETDRQCDGCMLPVSTLLYYCSDSDCHFCLHKTCAELPSVGK
ncbi:hypothetical protein F3Y22_tig00110332pilonHSYRG00681 [Hibiscus syriacus]|uniref:DC1 domain-containing protein n=1 Tax=Hibiscus syriacus TaxID=106335 RepID=A0A6A3AW40_HIBSY|nr:uncharacterized protein LOC120119371 [Hibiscus syriacus]KAE8708990.1 hypothetical protein F3Y22_tig00110332pilonHSYRG00681 [Hibiscus syriacus]